MKVNIDLTAAAAENLITDELKNNVGAAAFNMDHDFFYGSTEMEIWTGAGKTGTQLTEGVDYTLAGIDSNFTARAGRNVYTTVTIDNVTYQTGDLYFTYQATADYVDADDRYKVVRATGQYWELTAGGAFEIYTTDTAADSVKIDSAGGVDIDTTVGFRIDDDSGSYLSMHSNGSVSLNSAPDQNASLVATGNGDVQLLTVGGGIAKIRSASSIDLYAIDIDAAAGGIDIDAVLGIHIKDLYGGTGTGNGITLLADNGNASGTGGNIIVQTQATSGTSGDIVINSAGGIDVDSAAASNITVTSANLTLETITSGDIIVNSAGAGATAINVQTGSTSRIKIANTGDTVFYGTALTTGALPVITIDQADTDEPFIKVIGDAALADLTRDLVDTGDVSTPTIVGYLKIEVLDDGDQISDGDYFIPFYSLA